ncbi:MAG: hypothetical protein AAFP16_05205 [Pseudomonadota bacterium]
MTGLVFSYTDWQATLIPDIATHLGQEVLHIGRRTKPLAAPSVRSLRGFPVFEPDGDLPMLRDAQGFEDRYLSDYVDQMTRYAPGIATRAHRLERFYEYRDHFHLTARKVLAYLQRNKVSTVLYMNIPHMGDDYMFYRVAEWLGLPVIMLVTSLFRHRFFSTRSLEGFGLLQHHAVAPEKGIAERLDEELRSAVSIYMGGSYRMREGTRSTAQTLSALSILLTKCPRLLRQPLAFRQALGEVHRIRHSLGKYRRAKREIGAGRRAEIFLKWIGGLERDIDTLPERIVYLAMHYQPEMTSSPQGGRYVDQALLIEELSARLPQGVTLVAKENPLQAASNRGPEFIDRVSRCPNVIVAHPQMDTQALLAKSEMVATITGTVGWEAIKAGKPCLCFGYSWYRDCTGVTQFTPQTDVARAMTEYPDPHSTDAFLSSLIARAHDGVIYEAFFKDQSTAYAAENQAAIPKLFADLMSGSVAPTFDAVTDMTGHSA